MKKFTIALIATLWPILESIAACQDERIAIELRISEATMSQARQIDGRAHFTKEDAVRITEFRNGYPHTNIDLNHGYLQEYGNGDFSINAVNIGHHRPVHIKFYWDHEISYEDGLEGFYSGTPGFPGGVISLRPLKCSYGDFFVE